jgi:hypothetical protein
MSYSNATHAIAGKEVRVWSRGLAKHFWLTVEFFVQVSEGEVYKSPDKLEGFRSVVKFRVDGGDCLYELKTKKPVSLISSRYVILKNGVEIAKGSVTARNWYMFYGALISAGLALYAYLLIS